MSENSRLFNFKAPDWLLKDIAKVSAKYGISKGEFVKDCIKERLIKEELKYQKGIQENHNKDY